MNKVKLRQWAENQLVLDKVARQSELLKLADKAYLSTLEKGKAEARLRAEAEALNWVVAYKAEKIEALQVQLDTVVGADDRQVVAIAAIKLGMELGGTVPMRVPPTRKKKRLPKSRMGVRAPGERGRNRSQAGQK